MTRHLLKLFDNIADLRFKDSGLAEKEEANSEVVAFGMYSREGEYIQFSEPCVCEGQVADKRKAASLIKVRLCRPGFFCIANLVPG